MWDLKTVGEVKQQEREKISYAEELRQQVQAKELEKMREAEQRIHEEKMDLQRIHNDLNELNQRYSARPATPVIGQKIDGQLRVKLPKRQANMTPTLSEAYSDPKIKTNRSLTP